MRTNAVHRAASASLLLALSVPSIAASQTRAVDPGVRGGSADAGLPLPGLTPAQRAAFEAGLAEFAEAEGVGDGLGPRFNLDSCVGCHAQPAVGGTSPRFNPQLAVASAGGAHNGVPFFLEREGPVREARYRYKPDGSRDGGVHALFVVAGRVDEGGDASGCGIRQEDFSSEGRRRNLSVRIPTPVYGAGLMEQIPDEAILAGLSKNADRKTALGIRGRAPRVRLDGGTTNLNGNDGTITRFGWKAQNKSLLLFAGEAYNVEMGISNELFPTERDETQGCQLARTPNDSADLDAATPVEAMSSIEKFSVFMRLLAPPAPSPDRPGGAASIGHGRSLFQSIGCADCHTPVLTTGDSAIAALRRQPAALYSDLLLHNMGPALADDIVQAEAGGDEFRTAPLWGLGQRIYFLHDGRTSDLMEAIGAHRSGPDSRWRASEANRVVDGFDRLGEADKQDVLNFLRAL